LAQEYQHKYVFRSTRKYLYEIFQPSKRTYQSLSNMFRSISLSVALSGVQAVVINSEVDADTTVRVEAQPGLSPKAVVGVAAAAAAVAGLGGATGAFNSGSEGASFFNSALSASAISVISNGLDGTNGKTCDNYNGPAPSWGECQGTGLEQGYAQMRGVGNSTGTKVIGDYLKCVKMVAFPLEGLCLQSCNTKNVDADCASAKVTLASSTVDAPRCCKTAKQGTLAIGIDLGLCVPDVFSDIFC